MSYLPDERKRLEEKIRQQNLIHELVLINELLSKEEEKLRRQVQQIPKLKQKILALKKENQQMARRRQGQGRVELLREKANFFNQGQ